MKNFLSTDQDYGLCVLLQQTCKAISEACQQELKQYGISPSQAMALFVIKAIGDKATPAEVARWISQKPHSVSELISRMEKQGLVRKVKDLDRKNLVRVVLTEEGREAYYHSTRRESIHQIMSFLSEGERQQLRHCLQTLRDKAREQ